MIALGCDHGGYELKQEIIKYLEENNLPFNGLLLRQQLSGLFLFMHAK